LTLDFVYDKILKPISFIRTISEYFFQFHIIVVKDELLREKFSSCTFCYLGLHDEYCTKADSRLEFFPFEVVNNKHKPISSIHNLYKTEEENEKVCNHQTGVLKGGSHVFGCQRPGGV
jgi:hypothetical protein